MVQNYKVSEIGPEAEKLLCSWLASIGKDHEVFAQGGMAMYEGREGVVLASAFLMFAGQMSARAEQVLHLMQKHNDEEQIGKFAEFFFEHGKARSQFTATSMEGGDGQVVHNG